MKLITILLSIICLFISPASAYGIQTDVPISITVNDNYIKMDVPPFLYRDYTYVPVRFVSQALGADSVSWDSQNDTALVQYGGNTIKLQIGKNYGYVNGKYTPIKTGIMLISGRTFVPVRFVAETMGAQVLWEQDYLNVKITKQNVLVPASIIEYKSYTKEDMYWLSRIIEAESAGEPLSGKIAVGNVVLNRVKSPFYPNTIKKLF